MDEHCLKFSQNILYSHKKNQGTYHRLRLRILPFRTYIMAGSMQHRKPRCTIFHWHCLQVGTCELSCYFVLAAICSFNKLRAWTHRNYHKVNFFFLFVLRNIFYSKITTWNTHDSMRTCRLKLQSTEDSLL